MDARPALLFDLDGTLVDSALGIAAALSRVSAERGGGAVDVALVRTLVSEGAQVLVTTALGELAGEPAADLAAFRAMLRGIPADPAMIYPGVLHALEVLRDEGFPCAIVTNKPEALARQLLDELHLSRFFGAVVGGDTLPVCKPDPAPLLHAVDLLRCGRAGAWMIGDSKVDAAAAAAAGMRFALFEGGYGPQDVEAPCPVWSFAKHDELGGLLDHEGASLGEVSLLKHGAMAGGHSDTVMVVGSPRRQPARS